MVLTVEVAIYINLIVCIRVGNSRPLYTMAVQYTQLYTIQLDFIQYKIAYSHSIRIV